MLKQQCNKCVLCVCLLVLLLSGQKWWVIILRQPKKIDNFCCSHSVHNKHVTDS